MMRAPAGLPMQPLLDLVAGARPNFMKLAPVARALQALPELEFRIVHTGQHYDAAMTDVFFDELGIAAPAVHLGVGSGSHGVQTARLIERYEAQLLSSRPAACVVFGDVNSTLACALAAVKLGVPVAHVEAGLRSFDRTMPEEINRLLTDAVGELLLVTEPSGVENLRREGIPAERVRLVGNVMIDSLRRHLPAARARGLGGQLQLPAGGYGFVTLHRPPNVDDPATLRRLLELLHELGRQLPLAFAVHPRTRGSAERAGLLPLLSQDPRGLLCTAPLSYLDALSLLAEARLVITDSGGLQEESSVLGVPCLTVRETTERPITLERGTSRLLGNDPDRIREAFAAALRGDWPAGREIPLWDGCAGERVARCLSDWLLAAH
jgi:UDP-N-acetylglucosamine 2-epimerase (non-hydrolysing)